MSAEDLEDFYVHTVTVDIVTSGGSWGDTVEPSPPLRCFIDESRNIVRDSNGAEVVSSTTVTFPPEHAALLSPGGTVHLPERAAGIISVARADSGPLDLPDHIEVSLT